jgi:signal transduction histidine kinase
MDFRGSFSATVVSGGQPRELLSTMDQIVLPAGQTQELRSVEGRLLSPVEQTSEETPCGRASVTEATLRFQKEHIDLLFRISQVPGVRGFQAQAGIRNTGFTPVSLVALTPVALEGHVECKPAEWLVTALDQSVKSGPVVVTLDELQAPFKVHEYGGFYRVDGKGFLFGPVGTPTAYLEASIAHTGDGKVAFSIVSDMSGVLVKPGETRWGQQAGFFAEPPQTALPRWAAWVAKTHGARTDKHALSGWNSWQFHAQDITGKDVLAEVDVVVKNPERLRPEVMQIDSGYQDEKGLFKRESNDYFPEGMAFYAQRMAVTGARPGIFLNFKFLSGPGWSNIVERIQWATQGGYSYLKINRTELTLLPEEFVTKTSFEVMRNVFTRLRQAAGEKTYLLYNDGHPDRASVGLVDANRTGVTAARQRVRSAMTDVLRSYPLNSRWFAVDNDAYYMGTDIANVSEIAGGWPMVRTWMSMVGLSCGAAFTADPWHRESFQPYWRNVEVMTPPARERTEVVDLCTSREWPRLVGHVKRDWVDMTVALLWNPGTTERRVTLDFAEIGLHPTHRYAVWSFWDNRYLGVANGSWTTPALGPSASRHLCFTDLDRAPNTPVLIGSSLHIYCGAAEIKRVVQQRGAMEIALTDAGAREGDLFIYSRLQPVWKAAQGCTVAEIASAGEFVWRIHVAERQCGATQRITLGILLPVAHQIWFWVLIATVVASLLFAMWRYVAALRYQRVYALEKERSRIARDIHDDLGASLTQIALLSELTQADAHEPERVRGHTNEIFTMARTLTRSVDEIVWAVNPANDTVEKFAAFIGQYVERFARTSGLSCQLEIPDELSPRPMEASLRHDLFLATKEALNNVKAHAGARTVRLELCLTGIWLKLVIADDGKGFNPEGLSASGVAGGGRSPDRVGGGQGLSNMRQRMAAIAGRFEIRSAPGQGTRVMLQVKVGGKGNV